MTETTESPERSSDPQGRNEAVVIRDSLLERCCEQRAEIRQYLLDARHWNDNHGEAEQIDPDPDGELASLLEFLDGIVGKNSV